MEKKIAIAVDGPLNTSVALRYAAGLVSVIPKVRYVLWHIQATISQYLLEEAQKSREAEKELARLLDANRAAARELCLKSREKLIHLGVAAECIETRTRPRYMSVADDLLAVCQAALRCRYRGPARQLATAGGVHPAACHAT